MIEHYIFEAFSNTTQTHYHLTAVLVNQRLSLCEIDLLVLQEIHLENLQNTPVVSGETIKINSDDDDIEIADTG